MKTVLPIILLIVAACHGKIVIPPRGEFIELSTEPFEVPAINSTENQRGSRIVFGTTASAGQFPFFVLMFIKRASSTVQCGGGLISPDWVVSADHCVRDAQAIELRFGITHRDRAEQVIRANALARINDDDFTIVHLASSARITSLTKVALLPRISQKDASFENVNCVSCGMGIENTQTNAVSYYLKYANVVTTNDVDCKKAFGSGIAKSVLCAKAQNNGFSSACPGDSGSPLVMYDSGKPVIIGVVSFGAGSGCDFGYPVGYRRTSIQLDWIVFFTGIVLRP